jgi:carbon-monoxide dehydrogenase large subunit
MTTATSPGTVVARNEDEPLLRGAGRYLADLRLGQLSAVFVRSSVPNAALLRVESDNARRAPGVIAVLTAPDLDLRPMVAHASGMLPSVFDRPPLATDRVRFVGEPVAVVIALTAAAATDAAALVELHCGPSAPIADPEAALRPEAPKLFATHGSNVAFHAEVADSGALDDAELIVKGRFVNQRVAPAPMETNGALALPGDDGLLTIWASSQRVHGLRDEIAHCLGMPTAEVRVIAPLVGGGFGGKYDTPAETVVVAAVARHLGRAVAWGETRSENLVAMSHGRGQVQYGELGLRRDGTIVGLRCELIADGGGYPALGALVPAMAIRMLPWVYGIPRIDARATTAATSTSMVGAYRGPGRAEAGALIERLIDMAAVDPVDLRRRNLLAAGQFPFPTVTGTVYDCGDYHRALAAAVARIDYDAQRREQARRRACGARRQLGIGVAMWLDITPSNRPGEYAAVDVRADGVGGVDVLVRAGTCDQGQAHATTWGLIISGALGVPLQRVTLAPADTATVPKGTGTGSARSLQVTGGSVLDASHQILAQARAVAAHLLEANPDDIVVTPAGTLAVAGSPGRDLTWGTLAAAAERRDLPPEVAALIPPAGLGAEADIEQAGPTFPAGTHIALVEVDTETGHVEVLRFVAVDDCGRVINPTVVTGQQHGGVAQGIAQALYEQVSYDAAANPITTTFADYLVPSAADLPSFEVDTVETLTPINALGAKGIGQAGAIGATPAVQNAVIDALSHLGVRHIDLPLTPERVWRAIRSAPRSPSTVPISDPEADDVQG